VPGIGNAEVRNAEVRTRTSPAMRSMFASSPRRDASTPSSIQAAMTFISFSVIPRRRPQSATAVLCSIALLQRPDAGMDAQPADVPSLVGVDVPAVPAGLPAGSSGDNCGVAVDVYRELVDRQRWRWILLEVLDVALVAPHLARRSVEVREGGGENRLKQLPRPLSERLDELEI
jgi:hypothetical protein